MGPLILVRVGVVELAAGAGEVADDGRGVDGAGVEVDEVDAPLMGGGVVEAEGLRLDAEFLVGGGGVELLEVGVRVEELVVVGDAVVDDPGGGVVEAVGEGAYVGLLERFHSFLGTLTQCDEGGFFSLKNPLGCCGSGIR